jgi:large subunit ribosomal protein L10
MVSTSKKKTVELLAKEINAANTIALASIEGIPSKQFQQIRKKLRDNVKLIIVKNSLIALALEKAKVKELAGRIKGPSGIITTSISPFKLSRLVNSCKIKAPAKAGSVSPCDIVVPKGDTPFPAGPVIGDIQKAGIKAKIQGGKIVVTEDSLVVKKGGIVPAEAAGILARLGITPMDIGLGLNAAYEKGVVYAGDVLSIDEDSTKAGITTAHRNAVNLAFNAGVYTGETVRLFIQKAHTQAVSLAQNAGVVNKETVGFHLSKAEAQAKALNAVIPNVP